ncbi:MAG: NAD(P)/FAD-dependent oxidoreductase [Halodesulfurarchaeum sp.]
MHRPGGRETDDTRVLVVGGGVVGCAIASALSPAVAVTLVERDRIGAGTTARAAGEVTMTSSYPDYPAIADHANSFFREQSGPSTFDFTERESVEFVPPDRLGESRRRVDRLTAEGVPISFLGGVDASIEYPQLDLGEVAGLIRHEEAGFLDPERVTGSLARRASERGATIETGTTVTGLRASDSQIRGVETERGTLDADVVIVAAGWRTPRLLGEGVSRFLTPYRTQAVLLSLSNRSDTSRPLPMGWIPEDGLYFRPMGDRQVLVGGWAAAVEDPGKASRTADASFRQHVASTIPKRLEDTSGARLVDGWAGVDLATPDTRPIIDRAPSAPTGVLVASGFHGRGVMTAPVAGTAIRSIVLGESAPFPLEPFALDRFADQSPEFPFVSESPGNRPEDESEL